MMNKLPLFFAIFVVTVLDQLSKWWVLENIFLPKAYPHKVSRDFFTWMTEVKEAYLPPVSVEMVETMLNFSMVWNRGVSFGFLQQTGSGVMILIGATGAITLGLMAWLIKAEDANTRTSLVLIIGGAIGNIIDRVRFEMVIDFVDIYFGEWHYPAFNFADSCIVIGVLLLVINNLMAAKADKPVTYKKK
jgi:signal peptidase II